MDSQPIIDHKSVSNIIDSAVSAECSRTEGKISRKRKKKDGEDSSLMSWTREELETEVLKLRAHNIQLQNILSKTLEKSSNKKEISEKETSRSFDFSKYPKRHILLQFSYIGWDSQGFAVQDHTINTIEHALFAALKRTKLIESRETSNYHRCGRTDKGVSAFKQTISITVRCRLKCGIGVVGDENNEECNSSNENLKAEMNFPQILNKVLPDHIQVLCWAPVKENFSARFDCIGRTYRYFFPKGSLDIQAIRSASKYLLGTHDFRNICKMDVGNGVINFMRRIDEVNIFSANDRPTSADEMFVAEIKGQAFLWHQVRAIMTILFLVGQRKEDPSVMEQLLDLTLVTRKPQYCLASEIPLILYNSSYTGINWQYNSENIFHVYRHFLNLWTLHSVKSKMLHSILSDLPFNTSANNIHDVYESTLIPGAKSKIYKPLLERQTCGTLEEKVEHFVKRKRLDPDTLKLIKYKTDD